MTNIPTLHFLYLAAGLFSIGLFGVLVRKNAISVLMGVELMLNAVNINFLAFGRYWGPTSLGGPVFTVFVITLAAAEAAVALAIIIAIYRQLKTTNVDEADQLRG
ncbi:MAG TPA: NADH-quinone oxidoreductase subunit NuoK [bacterium]|nr:NADH-quinone oxidoreductase subunit NuoK [bacterium]